jgi:hypothetical protein
LEGVRGESVSTEGVNALLFRSVEAILAGAGGSGIEVWKLGMVSSLKGFFGDGDLSEDPLE